MTEIHTAEGREWNLAATGTKLSLIPPLASFRMRKAQEGVWICDGEFWAGPGLMATPLAEHVVRDLFSKFSGIGDLSGEIALVFAFSDEQALFVSLINQQVERLRWCDTPAAAKMEFRAATHAGRTILLATTGEDSAAWMDEELRSDKRVTLDEELLAEYSAAAPPSRWLAAPRLESFPYFYLSMFAWTRSAVVAGGALALYMSVSFAIQLFTGGDGGTIVSPSRGAVATERTDYLPAEHQLPERLVRADHGSSRWDISTFTLLAEQTLWRQLGATEVVWERGSDGDVRFLVEGGASPFWTPLAEQWSAVETNAHVTEGNVGRIEKSFPGGHDTSPVSPLGNSTYCESVGGVFSPAGLCLIEAAWLPTLRRNNLHAPAGALSRASCRLRPDRLMDCSLLFVDYKQMTVEGETT